VIASSIVPDSNILDAPVVRRKLSDEVLERLLRLIESIEPGAQLPSERELMTAFRVGRPAVREALQSLQQMGMISISHGERARVLSLTPETVFDQMGRSVRHLLSSSPQTLGHLKEARLMFEQAMVRLAVAKASENDLIELRTVVDQMANAPDVEPGSRVNPQVLVPDMRFHERIAAVSGNPVFAAVSKAMLDWLTHFSLETVHEPRFKNLAVVEHREIIARIAARDEAGAVKAMSDHLMRANELYRLSSRGESPSY
jgi:GntR family transcriptional regulator, sialic acid-inducible nan operon repressor